MNIHISEELKTICPLARFGYLIADVKLEKENELLWHEIDDLSKTVAENLTVEDIAHLSKIKETRKIYRTLGKDPTRYRVSSESLIRRIVKGKGLYKINNIVDIINYVSIKSHFSLGAYNLDKLTDPIIFNIGKAGESYKGIGRDMINVENLPVFSDTNGHFGSPTSDSERAMITLDTKSILLFVNSFSGEDDVMNALTLAEEKLIKYADAKNIKKGIIKK